MTNPNSKEFKAMQELENSLNSLSWNPQAFAEAATFMHRTNQQTLFRTIVEVIKIMASKDYGIDARNQASHETAKRIVESGALDDAYIPFI